LGNSKITKHISWILGISLALYLIGSIGFYLFQEKFIFQPKKLSANYVFRFNQPVEEHFIKTEDGETLNALLFKSASPSKGFILYFHGNAGNLQRWGEYAIDFTKLNYDVLMIDYRGYGKSTGKPSEISFYKDAQTVLNWSRQNVQFSKLVIYGRSLGSSVATHLAIANTPDLLILETPFDELNGVIYPPLKPMLALFPQRHYFLNNQNIPKINCPKVIFHGTDDWIVPLSSAEKLRPLLSQEDQFFIIEGGGHRNLRNFEEFHRALAEVLK